MTCVEVGQFFCLAGVALVISLEATVVQRSQAWLEAELKLELSVHQPPAWAHGPGSGGGGPYDLCMFLHTPHVASPGLGSPNHRQSEWLPAADVVWPVLKISHVQESPLDQARCRGEQLPPRLAIELL